MKPKVPHKNDLFTHPQLLFFPPSFTPPHQFLVFVSLRTRFFFFFCVLDWDCGAENIVQKNGGKGGNWGCWLFFFFFAVLGKVLFVSVTLCNYENWSCANCFFFFQCECWIQKRMSSRKRRREEPLTDDEEKLRSSSIVILDIGGTKFKTSRTTLLGHNSMFAKMVTDDSPFERSFNKRGEQVVFIDRDPTHFRMILNFLRCGKKKKLNHSFCFLQHHRTLLRKNRHIHNEIHYQTGNALSP